MDKSGPFAAFLYITSIILGLISGRLVRITRIDTLTKYFRFKNYWFYLFNGQHTGMRKMKYLSKKGKKHLFTKADVLIDTGGKSHLYSGIIVDYELMHNECQTLSKIMLKDAKRYKLQGEVRIKTAILGNILVLDCSSMKNINLTYVYEETQSFMESKWPSRIELMFSILFLIFIPLLFVKADVIHWNFYNVYFDQRWYTKFVAFVLMIQILNAFNPIKTSKDGKHQWVGWSGFGVRVVSIIILGIIAEAGLEPATFGL